MTPSPQALIGAALLAAGRPVTRREVAALLGLPEEAAARALDAFAGVLRDAGLGFEVEAVAGGYRLVVPPALAAHLAPLLAPPPLPPLSAAALEVLAVIAYRQPITRAEIEAMRGGSAGTVVTLQERELVKVVGRSDAVGQPLLYGTTERFLLEFGLTSLEDLPPLEGADFSHLLRS
ncbi:putative transcriptional regulator [Deinococcus geothermalis DSM 11300]|uniref:Transcriptional regulator n=1 Tax=Deinococcus geothermalis (strain DSM 11300 / CIP 105573 / AG-3a) TaxID=319795 RepID=Q1J0C3_DEIGD|nr:SMC-Scp complex subunit ScpB [Deinococcus geothermalis]ABF45061.1 putative transcriptional regulator [Deinococcus geothermalis DSM 11300]MBI0445972.1 SMC-Scp complex subunit ScpB [Deinococcus sp. DB0503]